MRLARPFIFFLRPHALKYVRPVALSARHVFFIVGHPVAAAAICGLRYFRAHVCEARSDETVPRLAERVPPAQAAAGLELLCGAAAAGKLQRPR